MNRRAADRLRIGYLWVYASDIESIELPNSSTNNPPALLSVADSRGILLGTALYSPSSQIALRLISREALDEAAWLKLLGIRLHRAILRRRYLLNEENDACRLCFSEADELPGLIADKYGDLVILQRLTQGLLSDRVRDTCVDVLREELAPAAILERPDPRLRELEGLAAPNLEPLFVAVGVADGRRKLIRSDNPKPALHQPSARNSGSMGCFSTTTRIQGRRRAHSSTSERIMPRRQSGPRG